MHNFGGVSGQPGRGSGRASAPRPAVASSGLLRGVCGRCATVPRCALCGASPCPVRSVPGCGWAVTPSDCLRGCVGFCGGCGCVFHINRYLRPPCAPVVPCGGSVCPLRGSDGVPCPAPPLRTICRPAWPVVRPVACGWSVCHLFPVRSVCGILWPLWAACAVWGG